MKFVPATICCLLILGSGVAAGVFTNRWEPAADFGPIQSRMDTVPMTLGQWTGRPTAMERDDLDVGGIRAHLAREYRDARSDRLIQVLLVAGKPGPIGVHTPDVCFQGAGYVQTSNPPPNALGASDARFWSAGFVKKDSAAPSRILVFWGWNDGNGWEATDHYSVRLRYSLRPVLYKLYIVTELRRSGETVPDVLGDFPERLLPELDRIVRPGQ